jgi:hypothetical protein
MASGVSNYGRFYVSFNKLPYGGDKDDLKSELVLQYTHGRTSHLHEMTRQEYDALCSGLEAQSGDSRGAWKAALKKKRSACLHVMQKIGVDTSDWTKVNAFCESSRIAGKPFARLGMDELDGLTRKLRGIERKGGLKKRSAESPAAVASAPAVDYLLVKLPDGQLAQA